MQYKKVLLLLASLAISLLYIEPVLAGPGGKIASAAFENFWGKILIALFSLLFLPLIIYISAREKLAERRARKDLSYMAQYNEIFDWLKIQERVKDCFLRVHSSWENEDLNNVDQWMSSWYWQNQQKVFLDQWQAQGLINHCKIKKISNLKPLLFIHRNDKKEHDNSMVVISITANMQDYLAKRHNNEIIEGSKKYKEVETIWSFTLEDGQWKVSNIEDASLSLSYAKLTKEIPDITSTLTSNLRI